MELRPKTLSEALQELVGEPLVSVDFVEDYVQLEWNKSHLTAHTMPVLFTQGLAHREGTSEYRHNMYRLEGQILERTDLNEGEAVTLFFKNGACLTIPLRDADYVTAEALLYRDSDGQLWVV